MLNISELDTVGEFYGIQITPLINLYSKKRKRALKLWRKNKNGGGGEVITVLREIRENNAFVRQEQNGSFDKNNL